MARISKDMLKKLQKTLKTDAKIGKRYGISRQAVHQLRVKYSINALKNKNVDRDKKIVGLYKKGNTGIKIAKSVRLSVSQVYRIIKKYSR
jgi:DNA-directed RNA polymerase specialized sigma subunit